MGAKTGYANVILACFGLTPGGKADAYLWCEPDPGARLLLQALPQPDVLREAASVLRGWASQDPRTLWEALRKEGAPKGVDGREVARWAHLCGVSFNGKDPSAGFGGWFRPRVCKGEVVAHMRQQGEPVGLSEALLDLPDFPPVTITEDARTVDPREVARTLLTGVWSYKQGMPESGFIGPGQRRQDTSATATATAQIASLCGAVNAVITDNACAIIPPQLPPGTVVFADPPYLNTSGYGHDLPRSEVVRMARLWSDAGAFVGVSEQEPIPELIADGWHAVEITHGRKGQKRTFSRQSAEFLTLNRPPVNPPLLGEQVRLWA